jgi:hypothetical protein
VAEWRKILTVPTGPARLGTLVRLALALGYDLDDIYVRHSYSETELVVPKGSPVPTRPLLSAPARPVLVDLGPEPLKVLGAAEEHPSVEPEIEGPAAEPVASASPNFEAIDPDPVGDRTCHKCGKVFASRNGRLIHNGRVHGDNPDFQAIAAELDRQREEAAAPPEPERRKPINGASRGPHPMLVCSEPACHFTTEFAVDMNGHARGHHGRPPTREERIPVPVDGQPVSGSES